MGEEKYKRKLQKLEFMQKLFEKEGNKFHSSIGAPHSIITSTQHQHNNFME
jgi:hypothetical protein